MPKNLNRKPVEASSGYCHTHKKTCLMSLTFYYFLFHHHLNNLFLDRALWLKGVFWESLLKLSRVIGVKVVGNIEDNLNNERNYEKRGKLEVKLP